METIVSLNWVFASMESILREKISPIMGASKRPTELIVSTLYYSFEDYNF